MGIEVVVEGLTKSFGRRTVWRDVTLALPAGEVSVMLGPSGTGKTVFLKSLIGLIKPERGRVLVDGTDVVHCSERQLYRARRLFGVMFQDGALFGSMNLYDNIAFPLREHTRKSESEIQAIVGEKMEMVGLGGEERKLPGEISGGMRKRAGLARALVLDPQIILCDEPDSGLDPVRTAYLSQLLIDLNAQIDATILIVTHNIDIARTVPDDIGMLFRGDLVTFGPREVLLTSVDPVVTQFVNGQRHGPIGMSEERDASITELGEPATMELGQPGHRGWQNDVGAGGNLPGTGTGTILRGTRTRAGTPGTGTGESLPGLVPQLDPSPGLPPRLAVQRRKDRVMSILYTLPPAAQQAILASLTPADRARYDVGAAGPGQRPVAGPGQPATRPLLPQRHRTPPGPVPPWAPPTPRPGPRDDLQEPQPSDGQRGPASEDGPQDSAGEDGPQDSAGEDGPLEPAGEDGQ